jgi:hypothetical protein
MRADFVLKGGRVWIAIKMRSGNLEEIVESNGSESYGNSKVWCS